MSRNHGYLSDETIALCIEVFNTLRRNSSVSAGHLLVMAISHNSPRTDHDALLRSWFIHGPEPEELREYCTKALVRRMRDDVFESHLDEIASAFDLVCQSALKDREIEIAITE
ncbi:hypothetical protein KUV57_12210 [Epibacterium sp. DP7N7-1]|nr:hypothetical protein [Epibacterium sp. DP7N7-1]